MRVGMNPMADNSLPPLPGIVAAVITHLPNRKGYHEKRFEVVQACFESLRDVPLYVWDNGSDPKYRGWLAKTLKPEYLMLSPNIGKASARTAILRSFPPKTVICMSDDDILYLPGWLDAQLDLLYKFPNVGAVSGCPIRSQQRWGNHATIAWARREARLEIGRFIPDEWEQDFCKSIGRDYGQHQEDSENDLDYRIDYNGMKAYAMAHHMQFICEAGRLSSLEYFPRKAMRAEQGFDTLVDNMGLLRLTTIERFTKHLGNILE